MSDMYLDLLIEEKREFYRNNYPIGCSDLKHYTENVMKELQNIENSIKEYNKLFFKNGISGELLSTIDGNITNLQRKYDEYTNFLANYVPLSELLSGINITIDISRASDVCLHDFSCVYGEMVDCLVRLIKVNIVKSKEYISSIKRRGSCPITLDFRNATERSTALFWSLPVR